MFKHETYAFDEGLIVSGFNETSTLWVILCCLSEKGRRETEEIVEMKDRDRGERGK